MAGHLRIVDGPRALPAVLRRQLPAAPPAAAPAAPARAPEVVFLSGEPGTPGHQYRIARMAAAAGQRSLVLNRARGNLATIARASVLWIWRAPMDATLQASIAAVRRNGGKVVFDIDDLMIDPSLANRSVIDAMRTQLADPARVATGFAAYRAAMLAADLCVATTEELAFAMRAAGKPALVIPNGFDATGLAAARRARAGVIGDGLLRLGYAAGSRTHQRDFMACVGAVAGMLRRRPEARLVLFRGDRFGKLLDDSEFAELRGLEDRIEWREHVPHEALPAELARFDIALAPLEVGNLFVEAKSELKFWEAALVGVPTIASPTGPYRRAIRNGETGLLARTARDWADTLELLTNAQTRQAVGQAAHIDVAWPFGPERRGQLVREALDLVRGGERAATVFALRAAREATPARARMQLPRALERLVSRRHCDAEVTVVVPLYNYARFVIEALDSVRAQTIEALDLVVVDDGSTDDGLTVATQWVTTHAERFGAATVLHCANSGLPAARNCGIALARTPWLMLLDADNRLRPKCIAACLAAAKTSGAAFAYPVIKRFGGVRDVVGARPYDPQRLVGGNYIDAMALVSRGAWAAVGGYHGVEHGLGLEDFDLWCRIAELGLRGVHVAGDPLAEYRVHAASMSRTMEADQELNTRTISTIEERHPWLRMLSRT